MIRAAPALAILTLTVPGLARGAEVGCWRDQGVLVVSASVAGVAGDYILDTGQAATQLHETRAQAAGIAAAAIQGEVRLAGQVLGSGTVEVADLDARTAAFPTPIAGVIGADRLRDRVLEVAFAPCRLGLAAAETAGPRGGAVLPLSWLQGRPAVRAAVADGPRTLAGPFIVATGAPVAVQVADDLAEQTGPPEGGYGRLRALSLGGALQENPVATVAPVPDAAGVIGAPALAGFRLRFDFPAGRLTLTPP